MRYIIISFLLAGLALQAQEGRIDGPVAAVFFDDASGSVRAINGVPGAGYFSGALAGGLDSAAVAPDGRVALLSAGQRVVSFDVATGVTEVVAEGGASQMVWSAGSDMAAFVHDGALVLWKRSGNVLRELGAAPEAVSRLAVDGSSESVFVAAENGITRYHEGEAPFVLTPAAVAGLALAADGKTLYAVDRAEHQVLEIDAVNGGASVFTRDAADPVGVALARDGNVLVADAETKTVRLYSRAARNMLSAIELTFSPARLEAIGEGVYMLNQRSQREALEVVALQPAFAAYFVPAPQEN